MRKIKCILKREGVALHRLNELLNRTVVIAQLSVDRPQPRKRRRELRIPGGGSLKLADRGVEIISGKVPIARLDQVLRRKAVHGLARDAGQS